MGAPVYDLGKDFPEGGGVAVSPAWIVAVVRLPLPLSFSRRSMGSVSGKGPKDAVNPTRPTLVIREDCVSLSVSGSKEQHVKPLQAILEGGSLDYSNEVLPGDWVLAWMVNDRDLADDLAKRIKDGEKCNGYGDGLKFVGRVRTVRAPTTWDPGGRKRSRYFLTAAGFRELDSMIFYDEALAESAYTESVVGQWLFKLGLDIRDLFEQGATAGEPLADNVHKLIPAFVDVLVGRGSTAALNPSGQPQLRAAYGPQTRAQQGADEDRKEAPYAYLVPSQVGALLGRGAGSASKDGGVLAYADLLEMVVGVQAYSRGGDPNPATAFTPDLDESSTESRRYTGQPLLGSYLPVMPPLLNTPLWSVLQEFLNPAVNEMYVCLRANAAGDVVPTLTVRQIPFTTSAFDSDPTGPTNYTKFLDLPRWKFPTSIVSGFDPGRTDDGRVNFVHVFGQASYSSGGFSPTEQLVQNQPVRDDLDVERSGLRMYQSSVATGIGSQVGQTPRAWMELIADRMIGAQWTTSGTLELRVGLSQPVCEGDNAEVDGVVYHVESVSHSCQQSPGGGRAFYTTLQLDNGTRSDSAPAISGADPAFPQYPGAADDASMATAGSASSSGAAPASTPLAPPPL